jgi:hypothetical protein
MVQGIVGCVRLVDISIHVVKGSRANECENDCVSDW